MSSASEPAEPRRPPNAGKGRLKGVPNKTTALLREAILMAAESAGGKEGLIGYLRAQARKKNSGPFLTLLGKVLPMQVSGDADNPIAPSHTVLIEFVSTDKTRREESMMSNPVADQALTHKRTPMARRMG
jgi:hypothetical protein